ncbi:MAG: PEP-CTERM sorting domain-containing protein [Lacipirellulaceae bacterium]
MNHQFLSTWRGRAARSASWLAVAAVAIVPAARATAVDLFSEDFDGLTLKPVVTFQSELRERQAWTEVSPLGWENDNSGVAFAGDPLKGVTEFEGWRFVDKDWWTLTAGDQNRSQFLSGRNVIAVADPDEWDDFGSPASNGEGQPGVGDKFSAKLTTPAINLAGIGVNEAKAFFYSSWRPEDTQKATLTAIYNRGLASESRVELFRWKSLETGDDPLATFKPDSENESLSVNLQNPAGAQNVRLEFNLYDAGNDWWWAFDSLQVFTGTGPGEDGALRVVINRDTGSVQVVNRTGANVDLRGYSVRSAAGAFDEAGATYLSATNSQWIKATQNGGSINDLSEVHLNSSPLSPAGVINLGPSWEKYFDELADVSFTYLLDGDNDPIQGIVEFVGNGGAAFSFLDLNFDGAISILDWNRFKQGFGSNLTGLTKAIRYQQSDLDNDGKHTLNDFIEFERAYDFANGSGAFAQLLAVPEPSTGALLALAGLGAVRRRRRLSAAPRRRSKALVAGVCFATACVASGEASAQLTLLSEDFESLPLGPNVEEALAGANVWTKTGPAGWTIDDSGMPGLGNPATDGITEWAGWSFADKEWWAETAGDQQRTQFARGTGTVMIADPDEWDDGAHGPLPTPPNFFDSFVKTRTINIPAGVPAGRIKLSFDSSWRPEGQDDLDNTNNQTATVNAIYNPGPSQVRTNVLTWDSNPDSQTFKVDAVSERVSLDLAYDGVATTMQVEFGLGNAWNDWWWAVDNILVTVPTDPSKLRINTANGQAFLVGGDTIAASIKGIDVSSANGVLKPVTVGGLAVTAGESADGPDAGTAPGSSLGEQWEQLTSSSSQFTEAYLFGSSTFTTSRTEYLGQLFNTATSVANRDVKFSYSNANGDLVEGIVEYFAQAGSIPGDFNQDGFVNAADYTTWRDGLGTTYTQADYNVWRNNYGANAGSASAAAQAVPEPQSLALLGFAALGAVATRFRRAAAVAAVTCGALLSSDAQAQLPPSPFVDRLYTFGEAQGATAGSSVTQTVSFDSAGAPGQNQLIDLLVRRGTAEQPNGGPAATYVTTADRPDGRGGVGIQLNASNFGRQYLRTGFAEGLNFPERSPSSTFSTAPGGGAGTIDYTRINDRGFEIWVKPTTVSGEQHIVMDTQQHGVLINAQGKFAMRYASKQEVTTNRAPGPDGILNNGDDVITVTGRTIVPADYASSVTATPNQWAHLSVVRAFGPTNTGSVMYVNGVAEAVAFGQYAVETIVNIDNFFTNINDLDVSPLTVGRATSPTTLDGLPLADSRFFRGVVDDLSMFAMGLNSSRDFGEYIFQRDNGYAQVFAPAVQGDLNSDGQVTLADASVFAANWLFEKRLTWLGPNDQTASRAVGDLSTRSRGDLNYDGTVDLSDWAILNNASPATAQFAMAMIQGIPEPSSLLLASLGIVPLGRRRRN